MFPFAILCKAQGIQSKQVNFIISELCRFIPTYKAGLSRHLPVKNYREPLPLSSANVEANTKQDEPLSIITMARHKTPCNT
jgi:hypothetical protein